MLPASDRCSTSPGSASAMGLAQPTHHGQHFAPSATSVSWGKKPSLAQRSFAARCFRIIFRKTKCLFSVPWMPSFNTSKTWIPPAQAMKAHPGGSWSWRLPLERRGALEGEPVSAAERGRSLLRTQEFRFLAGVHGGVHVIRVVSRLVPARLVGGLGHDGFIALAGHQGAAKAIRNRAERAVFWKAGGRLRVAAAFYHSNNQSKRLDLNLASSLSKHAFHYKERPFHMP